MLDVLRWLLRNLGIDNITSVKVAARRQRKIADEHGTKPQRVTGTLGDVFSITSLETILCHVRVYCDPVLRSTDQLKSLQEMVNPLVRPSLRFYPEQGGKTMTETWHGSRWHTADPMAACPMARLAPRKLKRDLYVFEPALARLVDGHPPIAVVPFRFYYIRGREGLFASVRRLLHDTPLSSYYLHSEEIVVPLSSFTRTWAEIKLNISGYSQNFPTAPLCITRTF